MRAASLRLPHKCADVLSDSKDNYAFIADKMKDNHMSTRFSIAILVFMMVSAVLFGVGITAIMSIPYLAANAMTLLPIMIAISFLLAAPVSWVIAPRLRARFHSVPRI